MSTILGVSFLKWVLISTIVGTLTGAVMALFLKSLEFATDFRTNNPWMLFLLPIGGALVSFAYSKYGKNSSKGNNLIIDKINTSKDHIPLRMAPLVFIGTFITHLFGGSAGREGTGVQIGSSIAESIGKLLKLDKMDTKIILMCGISSGFGSIFGTPLAGTIFGLEVAAFGTMSYISLIPCFFSAFIGNIVTESFNVHHAQYSILQIPDITYVVVLKVVISAVLFGLVSKSFSELTHELKDIFSSRFENPVIKSFIGGIIIIVFTYIAGTRDYLGLSLPLISDSFTGHVNPFAFLGKLIFTSFTLGTGFQGGEVTPLFVIGSTFGNALSNIINISPSFLAALGLIGVFAGATNAPIAAFVLGLEMFGSAGMEYMFMTCAISYLFSGHSGIYTSQKIGTSKSRLIKVPEESTIAWYRKKKIKEKKLKDNYDNESKQVKLQNQFKLMKSSVELPNPKGENIYKISVKGGKVRLNHSSFNPDGGIWSASPSREQEQHIDLYEGEHTIKLSVEEHFGQKDKITLVNTSFKDSVDITYNVNKVIDDFSLENFG